MSTTPPTTATMPSRRALLCDLGAAALLTPAAGYADMHQQPGDASAPIIVFDVNETILDFSVLAPVFTRIFDDASMLRTWFNQVVLYSEALTLAGEYANAGTVGVAVLRMLAEIAGRQVEPSDLDDLKRLGATMPTYADTPAALTTLRQAGLRLVTLSNNPAAGVEAQLTSAGLRHFFEQLHSIDDQVRRYKPARESYAALATTLGVAPSDLWLVSCHAFDTLGAAAAGYRTALVLRPGNAPIALGTAPDLTGADLRMIAEAIVAKIGPSSKPARTP